jgi:triacylglycerol lipase
MGTSSWQTGFRTSIEFFIKKGYKPSELYITTWGNGNPLEAELRYHSKKYISFLRAFVEAVMKYTGKGKINIISHSMGVTLARKVIKGGSAYDALDGGAYEVGPSLSSSVDVFIGMLHHNYTNIGFLINPSYRHRWSKLGLN